MAKKEEFDPQVIATTLMGCVQETCEQMCKASFSQDPEYVEKNIIEYNSRMRTFGLEKFNAPCFVAAINFYENKKMFDLGDSCGVLVLYVEEMFAGTLLKELAPGMDLGDEAIVLDCCGELCNVIAGQFKNEIKTYGFSDLTISAPMKYANDIPQGVNFHYSETKFYETSYFIKKEKALVVDITLAPIKLAN